MEIQIVAFTEKGWALAHRFFDEWKEDRIYYRDANVELRKWVEQGFLRSRAIVFVGAMGIAVRSIAPFVDHKLTDSPVLVMDELGEYVIPILSGHVGGANELAARIAAWYGLTAVITTATDLNGKFAIDVFAKKNLLNILEKDGIAKVSSKILRGERVSIYIENYIHMDRYIQHKYIEGDKQNLPEGFVWAELSDRKDCDVVISTKDADLEKAILPLKPREYILGIGCRKGKTYHEITNGVEERKIKSNEIAYIASIDLKSNEKGILDFSDRNRIEFLTYSAEELNNVGGEFVKSEFVREKVGVDNVCERAAMAAAGEGGILVMPKYASNGITLALAKRRWNVKF